VYDVLLYTNLLSGLGWKACLGNLRQNVLYRSCMIRKEQETEIISVKVTNTTNKTMRPVSTNQSTQWCHLTNIVSCSRHPRALEVGTPFVRYTMVNSWVEIVSNRELSKIIIIRRRRGTVEYGCLYLPYWLNCVKWHKTINDNEGCWANHRRVSSRTATRATLCNVLHSIHCSAMIALLLLIHSWIFAMFYLIVFFIVQ